MNLLTRLDSIAKKLPAPPAEPSPFSNMSEDELNAFGREILEQLKADIIKDPQQITKLTHEQYEFLTMEYIFYTDRPRPAIGADPTPPVLDELDKQMIPKLQSLLDSDPQALDKLPSNVKEVLIEKGLKII